MLRRAVVSRLHATARELGVSNLRVFGAVIRDPRQASDIDLLVDLEPGRTLLDLVAFRHRAEALLSMPVDVATPDMLKKRIRARILAEARLLRCSA